MGYTVRSLGYTPPLIDNPVGRWAGVAEDYWTAVIQGDRNLDGTYTEQGKAKMKKAEADQVQAASGGTMSRAEAEAIAERDVTASLTANNADPSQAGNAADFPSLLKWAALGAAGLVGLMIVTR